MSDAANPNAIAVVGMSCRFPRSPSIADFWANLRNGVDCITRFTDEELLAEGVPKRSLADPHYVKAGGCLDQVQMFDAGFFGYSPREAEVMDPQHRIFLECAWEALEDSGCDPKTTNASIGVYGGVSTSTYLFNLLAHPELLATVGTFQVLIGNDKDHLTTHVSYKLNLKGPSIAVQTACSTSLVAVAMACQSLLDYGCDGALAGGVTVSVPPRAGYVYREGGVASPDGSCRAFDVRALGTVPGNGAGVVVLKRLADALSDGDHIRAVLTGWAVNNDGSVKVGYTAPGVEGQAEVIAMAQAFAGANPRGIAYVETHGTGTSVGDPVEVAALAKAFRARTLDRQFCAIGSVKTNIGHLDTAAGIAGLIKTVLAVEHGLIPPSLHFERPNPRMDLESTPFFVNTKAHPWPDGADVRRAGVSSFGIGGTNAHVIVEQAPALPERRLPQGPRLLVLSAKTASALDAVTANLAAHLDRNPKLPIADVAWTLQTGRTAMPHRRALICESAAEAAALLRQPDHPKVFTAAAESVERPVFFLFPGQGAQYIDMTRGLYDAAPGFAEVIDQCSEILQSSLGLDLRRVLYASGDASILTRTEFAQPALFAVEYALAKLWMSWGIRPAACMGHSVGEYVAAVLAGVLTFEDAVRLVAVRGRLMQSMPEGAMLSVPLSAEELQPLLGPELSIAAANGALSVASGPTQAVDKLAQQVAYQGLQCSRLRTSHAFHSAMMDPVVPLYEKEVAKVTLREPQLPFVSNVTGDWITASLATDARYWARHLREPVRFAAGLERLLDEPKAVLLEVGPGHTASALVRRHPRKLASQTVVRSVRDAHEHETDFAFLLRSSGQLWLAGVRLDWQAMRAGDALKRVPLPTYPFERQRYWVDGLAKGSTDSGRRRPLEDWFYVPAWHAAELTAAASAPCRWLLLADGCGVAERLGARLRASGHEVRTAAADVCNRDSYRRLLDGGAPDRIVHLFGVTADVGEEPTPHSFRSELERGFYSLTYLVQALAERGSIGGTALTVVTSNESLRPEKAAVLGLCNALPQEHPGFECRSIDLDLTGGVGDADIELLAACVEAHSPDLQVAIRRGRRYVRSYHAARLAPGKLRLNSHGFYLITGGAGAVGLTVAEHLARRANISLVLTSRSRGSDGASLRRIKELGSRVRVVSADAGDLSAMETVLRDAEAEFGPLRGIIHAAGVTESRAFQPVAVLTPEVAEEHFRSKVLGALVIAKLISDREPDFCVAFSSISTVVGGIGYAAYAGANAFLDSFAQWQTERSGVTWVSVAWDGWLFGQPPGGVPTFFLTPEEGAESFDRILSALPGSRVIVSSGDLDARIRGSFAPPARVAATHVRLDMHSRYVAPRDELERAVAEIWQALLGIQEVGIHDNFFELGGHSLLAIQLTSRLRDAFQVEIPPHRIFEHATVAELAVTVRAEMPSPAADLQKALAMVEGLSDEEVARLLESSALPGERS